MLKEIEKQLKKLINTYNEQADETKSLMKVALVYIDQRGEDEDGYYDDPEDIPEELTWGTGGSSKIAIYPQEIEAMFYDRGWFPSDFC